MKIGIKEAVEPTLYDASLVDDIMRSNDDFANMSLYDKAAYMQKNFWSDSDIEDIKQFLEDGCLLEESICEAAADSREAILARHLGLSENEVEDLGENLYETATGEEYYVLTEEEANDKAVEMILSLFDDLGAQGTVSNSFFRQQLDDRNIVDMDRVNAIINDDILYYEEEGDQDMIDNLTSASDDDKIDYVLGLLDDVDYIVDLDKLAQAVVDTDGPILVLASYDGQEIDLGNSLYAYRIN